MGLDPLSIGVSIATNLATDILKHYAQYLEGTLVGRGLKAIGLLEPTQEDHLREILGQALRLYFTRNPAYDISGVIDFFAILLQHNKLVTMFLIIVPLINKSSRQRLFNIFRTMLFLTLRSSKKEGRWIILFLIS